MVTAMMTSEQQERARLTQQLVELIRQTNADHAEQARRLMELEQRNTDEHRKIMEWMADRAA